MRFIPILIVGLSIAVSSCNNEGGGNACSTDFDQEALFTNVADNLIIPGYSELSTKLVTLETQSEAFLQDPTVTTLENAQNALSDAWVSWQYVSPFDFGPAEEVFLRNSLNPFPVNIQEVENLVQNGGDNFDQPSTFDKGFPALDYLLVGLDNTQLGIITAYTTGPNAAGYARYLRAAIDDMLERVESTRQKWNNGFREVFVGNTGTAAGTALSQIINCLNENFEFTKRDRLGIPSGALTLGLTNPEKVEARFLKRSALLATESVEATRQLYLGQNRAGANGIGLDDYLNAINATKGSQTLHEAIMEQFSVLETELGQVADPFQEFVDADNGQAQKAYAEASNMVIFLKTDMASALCVSITYVDNPSDSD